MIMRAVAYKTTVLLTVYFALCTLVDYMTFNRDPFHFYEWMWPLQLLFVAVSLRYNVKDSQSLKIKSWIPEIDTALVFSILLIARFALMEKYSVWFDEHIQALAATTYYPVQGGSTQHQPPADMALMNTGLWLFGNSILGLRFHSCLFSALNGTAFYLLAKHISRSKFFALLTTFFFCTHHLVVRYGFEARPISLGLFMELLFLAAILSQLESGNKPAKEGFWLSGVTVLYLTTLGLQPPFVVSLTMVFLLLSSVVNRTHFFTAIQILTGLLVFAPLQAVIYFASPPRFTIGGIFSPQAIWSNLKIKNFFFLKEYYDPFGFVCFALLILFLLFAYLRKIKYDLTTILFAFLCFFLPLTLVPYFLGHVAWALNDYYVISLLPLILMLLVSLWRNLGTVLPQTPKYKYGLCCLIFLIAIPRYEFVNKKFKLYEQRPDLKGAYRAVEENRSQGDLLLSFCMTEAFCPDILIAKPFYLSDDEKGLQVTPSVLIYENALKSGLKPKNVFLILSKDWQTPEPGKSFLFSKLNLVSVYKVPLKSNLAETIIDFFKPLQQSAETGNHIYPEVLSYLVASYKFLGDQKEMEKYLEIYKNKPASLSNNDYLANILRK
jgi:hypothetical protein